MTIRRRRIPGLQHAEDARFDQVTNRLFRYAQLLFGLLGSLPDARHKITNPVKCLVVGHSCPALYRSCVVVPKRPDGSVDRRILSRQLEMCSRSSSQQWVAVHL
ncbi:hypothetical protein AB0M12_31870 [Nocardia vinacea]|uniref:hypothetical protein n=1 Tax=Nocardia vinacea TaxID=96468 RepID=UPI0034442F84